MEIQQGMLVRLKSTGAEELTYSSIPTMIRFGQSVVVDNPEWKVKHRRHRFLLKIAESGDRAIAAK